MAKRNIHSSLYVPTKGTTTNNNAAAGMVGEYVSSRDTSGASVITSNTFQDILSITLTAGDWDVSSILAFNTGGATVTAEYSAISIYTGNTTTDHVFGDNTTVFILPFTTDDIYTHSIPAYRLSLASTATVYLKGSAVYTGATVNLRYSRISARRVR